MCPVFFILNAMTLIEATSISYLDDHPANLLYTTTKVVFPKDKSYLPPTLPRNNEPLLIAWF